MGRWDRRRWFWAWVRLKDLAQEGTERKDEDAESLAGEAMVGGTAGAENFVISANLWRRKRYRWISKLKNAIWQLSASVFRRIFYASWVTLVSGLSSRCMPAVILSPD
jgi:hypothetical protein